MGGGPQIEVPPPGKVAMFVAAGYGLRTVTSCDDGRSWQANHIVSNSNDDHSPYAHKGLAYGDGTFVTVSGWGAGDSHMKVSHDGVHWQQRRSLDDASVGYSSGRFVILRSGDAWISSDRGESWQDVAGPDGGRVRGADGNGPAIGISGEGGTDPRVTWDGGLSFATTRGCPGGMSFGGLGQHGGFASGPNLLVMGSREGHLCVVGRDNRAIATRATGKEMGKPTLAKDSFWVPSEGEIWTVSLDGAQVERKPITPSNLSLGAIAFNPNTGVFVGVTTSAFWRSENGVDWQKVAGPSGPGLHRVVFGYGDRSAECP